MKIFKLDKKAWKAVLLGSLAITALSILAFHEGMNIPPMIYLLCGLAWGATLYFED